MYAITYKRNNLTISIKADEFHKVSYQTVREYYEVFYSGYVLTLYPEDILTIKPYKSRESKRGNCTR